MKQEIIKSYLLPQYSVILLELTPVYKIEYFDAWHNGNIKIFQNMKLKATSSCQFRLNRCSLQTCFQWDSIVENMKVKRPKLRKGKAVLLLISAGFVLLSFLERQKTSKESNSYSPSDNQPIKPVARTINNGCITAERSGN